ncbi:MAG: hypothetical protein RMK29_16480 [Myxococcales bacterium]|nr:hypothetical protein [Myxococcales bacterium]
MNSAPTVREQAMRLLGLLRHAARFWRTGLIVFILGCGVALVVALTRPRIYRSEALILYRERVAASALGRDEGGDPGRRIGMRLRELVMSRSQLEKIISEVGLYRDVIEDRGMAEAVDLMRQKVGFRAREGDTYSLSFEADDPAKAQLVTQKLTDALLAETERSHVELAAGTREFLDSEAERIESELKKREERLAKFLSEHPAFASEAARAAAATGALPGMAGVDPKKIAVPPPRRRSADPRIEALEREAERIQARLNPQPPAPQALSPEAREVMEEWNRKKAEAMRELEAAQRDLREKRQVFTDQHPDVKRAQGRYEAALRALDEVQLQSMRELARVKGQAPVAVQPLTAEERLRLQQDLQRIQGELQRLRTAAVRKDEGEERAPASEADQIVKLETTYVQLLREVAEAQEQRRQVEAKRFTAEIRDRLAQTERGARMVVIDPPYRPTRPVRGGRTQVALIGGVVSFMLSLLVMFVRALLDDRLYGPADVELVGIGPVLTAVPPPDPKTWRLMRREARLMRSLPPRSHQEVTTTRKEEHG